MQTSNWPNTVTEQELYPNHYAMRSIESPVRILSLYRSFRFQDHLNVSRYFFVGRSKLIWLSMLSQNRFWLSSSHLTLRNFKQIKLNSWSYSQISKAERQSDRVRELELGDSGGRVGDKRVEGGRSKRRDMGEMRRQSQRWGRRKRRGYRDGI